MPSQYIVVGAGLAGLIAAEALAAARDEAAVVVEHAAAQELAPRVHDFTCHENGM